MILFKEKGNTMEKKYQEQFIKFGLKVQYYRKLRGMTQEAFAEKIDESVNFLAQVEGPGTIRGVSLETLFKISQVLNVPASKFLEDD